MQHWSAVTGGSNLWPSHCHLVGVFNLSNVFEVAQVLLCILAGDPHGCKKYWEHAAQVEIPCCKCILKTALWRVIYEGTMSKMP